MKKVALYDPYLDTLGGGEKHVLSILKALKEYGLEINIFWNKNLKEEITLKFGTEFIHKLNLLPNIFNSQTPKFKKLLVLKNFDIFVYVTDGSYFVSSAKKNFVFCMYPKKELYNMNLVNKFKTKSYKFISNSPFTERKLSSWGIKSQTILPYLDDAFINVKVNDLKKEKIILSVGRFFEHLHSKQQFELINAYKKLKQFYPMLKEFKLILAGGLKEEDKQYFNRLKKIANDDSSISILSNLPFAELLSLYKKASCFWHFTGFAVDENKYPEQVEHLGISPLEAMATGNIVFCYAAGGPKEIIEDGNNGFLFENEDELFEKMLLSYSNTRLQENIRLSAKKYVTKNFNYLKFRKRVEEVLLK